MISASQQGTPQPRRFPDLPRARIRRSSSHWGTFRWRPYVRPVPARVGMACHSNCFAGGVTLLLKKIGDTIAVIQRVFRLPREIMENKRPWNAVFQHEWTLVTARKYRRATPGVGIRTTPAKLLPQLVGDTPKPCALQFGAIAAYLRRAPSRWRGRRRESGRERCKGWACKFPESLPERAQRARRKAASHLPMR